MNQLSLQLTRPDLLRSGNFIAGEWCAGREELWHPVADPGTGEVFARVPDGGQQDARDALDAAHAAFQGWRESSARERARLLKAWHALILANELDLARLMSREQGKPLAEARGEVAYGAAYVEWFAEEAVRAHGDMLPQLMPGRRQMTVKEPVGVCAAITPWNFPLAMIARKIAPALAAGCTVVAKPAEDTPLTALALVALLEEAGAPAGVVNVVCASRERTPQAVDAWLADSRVRKITFTGSTAVGKHLARESAATLKRLSLELGGNAPFVVFADADLDAAVDGLMRGKFRNSGQTCVSPNRVLVEKPVYEAFAAKLVERVRVLKVGPANRADTQIGPMINARAIEKIERHVEDALGRGAKLLAGGGRVRNPVADGPYYYAPTVLGECTAAMALHREETFGPVVPLFVFEGEEAAVRAANDTPFGLASYFYTRDPRRIWNLAARLECGVVGINEGVVASEAAPFGGVKESGYGREGSRHGLDDYMQVKYLCQGELA